MNITKLTEKTLLSAIMGFLFSPFVMSAEKWSYSRCLEYAEAKSIDVRQSLLQEDLAVISLNESKGAKEPSLDFSTNHGFTNAPWGNFTNSYISSYAFNAGWIAYDGGIRGNTIRKNQLSAESARLSTSDLLQTIRTTLLEAYLNILYYRESIAVYEEAASLSKAQMERAKALMEAGKVSRVDYAQLKAQYEQADYSLVEAESNYRLRLMELKKILELGIDSEIEPEDIDWSAVDLERPLASLAESYQLALQTDVKMHQLDLEKEISEYDIKIAKGERLPKISLTAGIATGYTAPGESFVTSLKQSLNENVGINLSVPILDNKKAKSAIARANISRLNADLDKTQRELELARSVENWYVDTSAARARYKAALEQLESARLVSELTNEQFQLGLINTIELMTSTRDLVDASISVMQAKYMALLGEKMIEFYRSGQVSL